jgi:uncharacterized RDD family membrane protein YckC
MPDPETGVALAAWWKRLVAAVIDTALLAIVGYLFEAIWFVTRLQSLMRFRPSVTQSFPTGLYTGVFAIWGSTLVITLLYYGLLVGSRRGQTVGMMIMGLAVQDARAGGPIGYWRAFARQLVAIGLTILFEVPFLIDCLAPLWDRRRQAWHDRAVGCLVIDLRP